MYFMKTVQGDFLREHRIGQAGAQAVHPALDSFPRTFTKGGFTLVERVAKRAAACSVVGG